MKEQYSWHKDTDKRWTVEGPGFYMVVESESEAMNLVAALNGAYNNGVKAVADMYVVSMVLFRQEGSGFHTRLWQNSIIADSKMGAAGIAVFTALEEKENRHYAIRSIGVISIAGTLEDNQQEEEKNDGGHASRTDGASGLSTRA